MNNVSGEYTFEELFAQVSDRLLFWKDPSTPMDIDDLYQKGRKAHKWTLSKLLLDKERENNHISN